MSLFTDTEEYVAKRPHLRPCDLCGEAIVPGQACAKWAWFGGDGPMNVRVHAACREEAKKYEWYSDSDGWPEEYPLVQQRIEDHRV